MMGSSDSMNGPARAGWSVVVASDPDCEDLTAEIALDGVTLCVLDQEEGADRIRFSILPSAATLGRIELHRFQEQLAIAKQRLFELRLQCPVCGFDGALDRAHGADCARHSPACGCPPPRCPSCGFHFRVTDLDPSFQTETARTRWISDGMRWWSTSRPAPPGWDPVAQLRRLEGR